MNAFNFSTVILQELQRICGLRRDPAQPPLDPTPLVDALNLCSNQNIQFDVLVPECALEFMNQMLDNLELLPQYMSTYHEVGDCAICGAHYRQVDIICYNCSLYTKYPHSMLCTVSAMSSVLPLIF